MPSEKTIKAPREVEWNDAVYAVRKDSIKLKDAKDYYNSPWFNPNKQLSLDYIKKRMRVKPSENIDKIAEEIKKSREPYIENFKKLKYGSKEWFDERERFYDKMDSFEKSMRKRL